MDAMEGALFVIIVVVVAVGLIAGIWASLGSGEAYRQIGRGPLSLDDGIGSQTGGRALRPAAPGERETEIRQLLEARNARRAARGQQPLDVEAELARLLAPSVDPALEAEVRELVIARNERRARAGKPPLDVDEEVARQLRDLT
jgi:hypothetical protein